MNTVYCVFALFSGDQLKYSSQIEKQSCREEVGNKINYKFENDKIQLRGAKFVLVKNYYILSRNE